METPPREWHRVAFIQWVWGELALPLPRYFWDNHQSRVVAVLTMSSCTRQRARGRDWSRVTRAAIRPNHRVTADILWAVVEPQPCFSPRCHPNSQRGLSKHQAFHTAMIWWC